MEASISGSELPSSFVHEADLGAGWTSPLLVVRNTFLEVVDVAPTLGDTCRSLQHTSSAPVVLFFG